jgi:type IV secretion system protein VirD4
MNAAEMILQLGTWAQHHSQAVLLGMGAVPIMVGAAEVLWRRRATRSTVFGSARWGTLAEARQAGLVGQEGIILGRLRGTMLADGSESHVLLAGPTRSGKGIGHIVPSLRRWRGSALVLDPKDGENAAATRQHRGASGRVACFTPYTTPQARLDVTDTIRVGTPQDVGDATLIAQSLVAPERQARDSATAQHFRDMAAMVLTAGLLHLRYTRDQHSLAALWHFLTQEHGRLTVALQAMAATPHRPHGVHPAIASLTRVVRNVTGDREASSIWSTAIRPLALYADPLVAASTDRSTLRLEELQYGTDPLTLYLQAPSPRAVHRLYPVYRVVLEVAMARLMEPGPHRWGHRLLLCLDELPVYGYVGALDKGAADMAGYGMKGLFVVQDLHQLDEVYGEQCAIWGNTPCKIFHTPASDQAAKRISEAFLGRATVAHPVTSQQGARRSVTLGDVGRPLLTPAEVLEIPPTAAVVWVSGLKPLMVAKVDARSEKV